MDKKTYKTIDRIFSYEIDKIKGSRFIGYIIPIISEENFKLEINKLKKKYHDARHYCYAYVLGQNDSAIIKYSDDGEPSKTAGAPIFNVLKGSEIVDALIVVIRYFGGTKLGTGGLIKAYTKASQAVIENAETIEIEIKETIKIKFSYDLTKQIYYLISTYDAKIKKEDYGSDILFEIDVNVALIKDFKADLIEKTDGRGVIC